MQRGLLIASLILLAVSMALPLAHALERPGKLRLDRKTYRAVRTIYYPGFAVGGVAEPLGILALLALLWTAPWGARLWWIAAALGTLALSHATYWLVTHPVNNVWTREIPLSGPGAAFFSTFAGNISGDWARLRDVSEFSHVVRSVFATLSFVFLTIAATGDSAAP